MINFFNSPVQRTGAFAMLLVWVFALISGVANACLLEAPGINAHVGIIKQSNQHGAKHMNFSSHVPIEAELDQADDTQTSKQPCLKVCADSSKSLPKKHSGEQIDPGTPIIVAVLWSLIEPINLQYEQPNDSHYAASQLPLRLLYSRLALLRADGSLYA